MKKFIIGLSFALALIAFGIVMESMLDNNVSSDPKVEEIGRSSQLKVADKVLTLHMATTPKERNQGLSGFSSLGEREGMFFVFEDPGFYGFWMKEMQFPIDIIWLNPLKTGLIGVNENLKDDFENVLQIVHIERNVSPESFPDVFQPLLPAQYVLEVNSGFSVQNNLKKGDQMIFLRSSKNEE